MAVRLYHHPRIRDMNRISRCAAIAAFVGSAAAVTNRADGGA
jgi:hypothetical protein